MKKTLAMLQTNWDTVFLYLVTYYVAWSLFYGICDPESDGNKKINK
jgi:hypothetical protein